MEQQEDWVYLLAGTVTFFSVFMQMLTKTVSFKQVFSNQPSWKDRGVMVMLLGSFSILGTYMGIELPSGAVINVRDLGPIIAGLTGGPLIGFGAGLAGGLHRYFMGGFTCIPCALATVIIGLAAGVVRNRNGDRLIGFWWAVIFAALMECLHMGLVLLIARPFSETVDTIRIVVFPMVLASSVGVAIGHLFVSGKA